jgi:DNA-binding CsgD family transcriptional regulator
MVRLGELWRSGADQVAWPVAVRELPNLRACFDQLIETARVDDAERFVVAAFGPIACQFDVAPTHEWAPRARAIDPDHVGPSTASVCACAAWGAIPRSDLDGAAEWLRHGVEAIEAGSQDDGLVSAAAIHLVLSGGERAVSDEFLRRSIDAALLSDDLYRQTWVLTYAGRVADALERAQRLGNRTLVAMARSWDAALSTEGKDEACELFWEAAQESHSFLMRNHAAIELGNEQIRTGAPLDGLLLLRGAVRDWLVRGDSRVWTALHGIAVGFAVLGEFEGAARLAGAIGDRPLPFVSPSRRAVLGTLLQGCDDASARSRDQAAGRELDAGSAAADALARIEVLASRREHDAVHPPADEAGLTTRQHQVAELVARGFTNKQIAQRLGISRFTAETHVRNILERLGAASRSEIATWFAREHTNGSGTALRT